MKGNKRGRLEIIYDILKIVRENHKPIRPTPLLRKSNISSKRFKKYFSELIIKDFLREINRRNGKYVIITEKGNQFLEKYKTITQFIDEFEL